MTSPRVSIICIAKDKAELAEKQKKLSCQTYHDYEFVGVAGGSIPEAWNRTIERAKGEILVFTETDAEPVYNTWLEELVKAVSDERVIVKGLEVTGLPWDFSNLACHRSALVEHKFDENFKWAEDSELFCRLRKGGYELRDVPIAPVIHLRKMRSKRLIRRAFRYGIYHARLRYRYRDSELVSSFELVFKQLSSSILHILGLCIGYLIYWPELLNKSKKN